ncbi:MAG: hypothetical protein ABIP34_04895 [Rhodoferax sp.]|uniref:hypothetical protein n=1 Tax=Rhodoferax sp. TaxID=50421 RepID=UPI003266159D
MTLRTTPTALLAAGCLVRASLSASAAPVDDAAAAHPFVGRRAGKVNGNQDTER